MQDQIRYLSNQLSSLAQNQSWQPKFWPPTLVTICAWVTKIGSQCLFSFSPFGDCWFSSQMATNKSSPHLQIRHNLRGLLLTNLNWLHPIVFAFNTLCPVEFYIQWCGALHWIHWGTYFEKLFCPWLGRYFSKLISQSWGITEPQYFITLLLDSYQTYFWKHYIYYKKDTKVGSQNFGHQIWFWARLFNILIYFTAGQWNPCLAI